MNQQEIERIARTALKDLGVPASDLIVAPAAGPPGRWTLEIRGKRPRRLTIRCGDASTAQWVRQQIVEQYQAG